MVFEFSLIRSMEVLLENADVTAFHAQSMEQTKAKNQVRDKGKRRLREELEFDCRNWRNWKNEILKSLKLLKGKFFEQKNTKSRPKFAKMHSMNI